MVERGAMLKCFGMREKVEKRVVKWRKLLECVGLRRFTESVIEGGEKFWNMKYGAVY